MNAKFAAKRAALSIAPIAAAALMAGFATSAGAVVLAAGDNALGGTTSAAEPQLAGTVVQDVDQALSWSVIGGTMNASVQSRVVLSDDGTYDFYWRVHDTSFQATTNLIAADVAGPRASITAFRLDFSVPVEGLNGNYRTDGVGDQGPNDAFDFGGGFVNFIFGDNGLPPGQDSYFMFLDTNATHYALNSSFDLASDSYTHNSDVFSTFGVAGAPEPAQWSLMIMGFGVAGAAMRARRKAVSAA